MTVNMEFKPDFREKSILNFNINLKLGEVISMRHLKNEVDSIKKDIECGLQLADKSIEPAIGDKIVCYTTSNQKQTTDWNPGF